MLLNGGVIVANTGYSVNGGQCFADFLAAAPSICPTLRVNPTDCGSYLYQGVYWVYATSATGDTSYPVSNYRNCDPTGGVLTVQDGVSLGWMVGGTILMVGVVMFLGKVVKL